MTTTLKAIVRQDRLRPDGTFPIRIRLTHNRKVKYISTPWFVAANRVGKDGSIKDVRIDSYVYELIRSYRLRIDEIGVSAGTMSADELADFLLAGDEKEKPFALDFVQYTRDYAAELRSAGKVGTAATYGSAINSLVRFAGRDTIDIRELTSRFIQSWIDWIPKQFTGGRVYGGRAQSSYFTRLQAMHNRARKEFNDEEKDIIRIPYNPFAKATAPKPLMPRKRALTIDQLRALFAAARPDADVNKRFNLSRDAFMLSFMLVGMNAADLYDAPASAFDGERITYKRKKTRDRRADEAEISIKVEPEVLPLIQKYRDPKGERLFKFWRLYSQPSNFNAALSKGLKQVGAVIGVDDLEFYAARHSWATIAVNDADVDKYTVHDALNHVDPSMKVTDMYIKKNWSKIDRANRKVLDLILGTDKE